MTSEKGPSSLNIEIAPADPAAPEVVWCFKQYFSELGRRFEAGFDPGLSISAQAHELRPPNGLVLLAKLGGKAVGCCALKLNKDAPGEVKRMWVSPGVRGGGVGRRLLEAVETKARENGVKVLHLETNRSLVEAIRLYRYCGYREVKAFNKEPYAHHWFEKRFGE